MTEKPEKQGEVERQESPGGSPAGAQTLDKGAKRGLAFRVSQGVDTPQQGKTLRDKQIIITEVCFMLQELLPNIETINIVSEYNQLIENLSGREKGLCKLLVHTMTALHQHNRLCYKGIYQTEREDILISLQLLGPTVKPGGFLSPYLRQIYHQIKDYFGYNIFTRSEAQRILGYGKTQTCSIMNRLVEKRILARGNYASRGYTYQLLKSE